MNLFKRFIQYIKEQTCIKHHFVDASGDFVANFRYTDCSCIHCGLMILSISHESYAKKLAINKIKLHRELIEFKQSLMLRFQHDQFEFQKQLFKSALEKKFHNQTDEFTTHINEEIEAFLNEKRG